MEQVKKTLVYDDALHIEAYRFQGLAQPFPCHFHEYYVIGLVEAGERTLTCQGRAYAVGPGDVLLFNPGDSHACVQSAGALDYRALNISRPVMAELAGETAGRREPPRFTPPVLRDGEVSHCLRGLHQLVLEGSPEFGREEALLLLVSLLLDRGGPPLPCPAPACRAEVERACVYMRRHLAQRVTLDQVCRCAGLSRSTLLRAFAQAKGVTPYRYLESVRIAEARALLERGVPPAEAALRSGFSDQSHFTNCFGRFTGLSPGAYQAIFHKKEGRQREN